MKKIISAIFMPLMLGAAANVPYRVTIPVHEEQPGTMVYLYNRDTQLPVDSVAVAGEQVSFTGDVDEPWPAMILIDGKPVCKLIVEEGSVAVNRDKSYAAGMMYNDMLKAYYDQEADFYERFSNAGTDQEKEKIYDEYFSFAKKTMLDNADNPVGFFIFLEIAADFEADEMLAFVDANPTLGAYRSVATKADKARKALDTAEGRMFVDFEVEYDGKTERLSDYVGKGQYTLVDFWASWCGPCMREMPVLKDIYAKHADNGLQVLGVAVWDKPEDTKAALERLQLPWHSILNAQTIATDAYGINGIPCIILFGPDGTIVSRGARGDGLKAVVDEVMPLPAASGAAQAPL